MHPQRVSRSTKHYHTIALLMLLLPSCTTRLVNIGDDRAIHLKQPSQSRAATEEQRVLDLVTSSAVNDSDFKVNRIDSLRVIAVCGNPLLLSIFTCGIVPGSIPATYIAKVQGMSNGRHETREYRLLLNGHFSAWHSLIPQSHDDRALARALLGSIREDRGHTINITKSR